MGERIRKLAARTGLPFQASRNQLHMSALQTELEALRHENDMLVHEHIPALQRELEALRHERNMLLWERVPALQTALEELRHEKNVLAGERVPALQSGLEALRHEKNVLEGEALPALQSELEALRHERNVLSGEVVPALQAALEVLRHEKSVLTSERVSQNSEVVRAQAELERLRAQLDEVNRQFYSLNSSFRQAVTRNDELMRSTEVAKTEAIASQLCDVRDRLASQLELMTSEIRGEQGKTADVLTDALVRLETANRELTQGVLEHQLTEKQARQAGESHIVGILATLMNSQQAIGSLLKEDVASVHGSKLQERLDDGV